MNYEPMEQELMHVHTYRCKHAGTAREFQYIDEAIRLGAKRIAFTDHAPFPGNPFTNRMDYEELAEYVQTIRELKKKYEGQIEILCGLEVEFLPSFLEYFKELRAMEGMDILLVGQHFYEHKPGSFSYADPVKTYEFEGQCEAMAQAIETQLFDIIAHPDRSFRVSETLGNREQKSVQRILSAYAAADKKPYLEKNISSMRVKGFYKEEFWRMVPPETKITFGVDAHNVDDLTIGWEILKTVR